MRNKHRHPSDPRAWFDRAYSNMARAKSVVPNVLYEDMCFDAQQAAEKANKAVFVHRGIAFPFTHDISR